MLKLILSLLLTIVPIIVHAADYYISQLDGDDSNNGLTPSSSFQSLARVNSLNLLAGIGYSSQAKHGKECYGPRFWNSK